jgi:hypothetical protein
MLKPIDNKTLVGSRICQEEGAKKFKKTEKGMAFIEAIPVLFMVVVVFNFSLGFFGAIHSGILNSIAAYNYAMETYRFRSNLMYFRPGGGLKHYEKSMSRVHGVTADGTEQNDLNRKQWPSTVRSIAFNPAAAKLRPDEGGFSRSWSAAAERSPTSVWGINYQHYAPGPDDHTEGPQTPEIWVKTVYGICLNADCKP